MEISINNDQRLYFVKSSEGAVTYGFDHIYGSCMELVRRIKKLGISKGDLNFVPPSPADVGTEKLYFDYQRLLGMVSGRKIGTWFSYDTPNAVRLVLEKYRKEGGMIRIFYGDKLSGRCWMEENDVLGRVGRSTGTLQIPLLIGQGQFGGAGILDSCIVQMIDAETHEVLYKHKAFFLPEMDIRAVDNDLSSKGYTHGVWVKSDKGDFENFANFKSLGKAAQWVAFMAGDCTEQPE